MRSTPLSLRCHGVAAPVCMLALLGCSSALSTHPKIAELRDVTRARAVPRISKVMDLGALRLPDRGRFNVPPGDGTGTVGELLLIWGSDFGKQPAVTIGSQPTAVLRHVDGGGVVVRVPWGIAAGAVPITVSTLKGRTTRTFPIRRIGMVGDEKEVLFFTLGAGSALHKIGSLASKPVRALSLSNDGAAAYAIVSDGNKLRLVTYDLTAAVPRRVTSDGLPGTRLVGFARARGTHLSAILTDSSLIFVDTRHAVAPALYKPHPLPRPLRTRSLRAVALSPDGGTLAMLADDKNELLIFDSRIPAKLEPYKLAPLLPTSRVPMVADLDFTLDGQAVWVIAGDTRASLASGHRPLLVISQPVAKAAPAGPPVSWTLDEARAPMALVISRSAPTPEGTAIREKTASSAGYIAAVSPDLVAGKARAFGGGRVVRSDAEKTITTLLADVVPAALAVGGRPQDVLVLGGTGGQKSTTAGASSKPSVGSTGHSGSKSAPGQRVLIAYPAWAEGQPGRLALGTVDDINAPLGHLLVQP